MNRLLALAALLAVVSSSAAAEWVTVATYARDEPGGPVIVYVDPATIRRSGNLVKIWQLNNYTTPRVSTTGASFRSVKILTEHDCIEERARSLFITEFSQAMGAGILVGSSSGPEEWIPIPPGSIGEIIWKYVCKKR